MIYSVLKASQKVAARGTTKEHKARKEMIKGREMIQANTLLLLGGALFFTWYK